MGKPRNIGDDIVKLRKEGNTYSQIIDILGCTKSTISYHVGANEKRLSAKRQKKYREDPIYRRSMEWEGFEKLKDVKNFSRARQPNYNIHLNRAELMHEYIKDKYDNRCYISGRLLPDNFSEIELDHIHPKSKGGSNDITNMGPTLRRSNAMKSDMTVEELLDLCKDTLEYHGYKVKKND
jgi:hypothetical protein